MHEPIYNSIPPRDRRTHLLPEATVATHPEKKKSETTFLRGMAHSQAQEVMMSMLWQ